tara:strand:- start:11249 stop:11356 length:108 start_codon:yes stop_codon:yes gene_type:complete
MISEQGFNARTILQTMPGNELRAAVKDMGAEATNA